MATPTEAKFSLLDNAEAKIRLAERETSAVAIATRRVPTRSRTLRDIAGTLQSEDSAFRIRAAAEQLQRAFSHLRSPNLQLRRVSRPGVGRLRAPCERFSKLGLLDFKSGTEHQAGHVDVVDELIVASWPVVHT
jgi:hypothetical protein